MKKNNNTGHPLKTVLIIIIGLTIISLLIRKNWITYVAITIGLLAVLSVRMTIWIDYLWMKLSWILSFIMPNILLSVIYFVFLTPIAFFSRIFGDKNLLSIKNTDKSLFRDTNKSFQKESFEKTW